MDKICQNILSSIPERIDFDFITVKTETIKYIHLDNPADNNILFRRTNFFLYIFQRIKSLTITLKSGNS